MHRSSGVLLPLFSLPSGGGIGTMGARARAFVDFLAEAGQSWWQLLPVGPPGKGDSPYQSFSAFAGSPYFIDLGQLADEGLISREAAEARRSGAVDYRYLGRSRPALLRSAYSRETPERLAAAAEFASLNGGWLRDYALYMALRDRFGCGWDAWPDEGARSRRTEALERWSRELEADIGFYVWTQYRFFEQWAALREYARSRGVGLIGDLPIYLPLDSADVWAMPEQFLLDSDGRPTEVAGVPPDYFSSDGQLWGNPLYNWDAMRSDGFGWWRRRAAGAGRMFDALRIDHFRGIESYWAVPARETTARSGRWRPGPGLGLVDAMREAAPGLELIAEDLGALTDGVRRLLADSGLPGMKVLEFAFDPSGGSDYLPHRHVPSCVCYTGTHDNAPLAAWLESAPDAELDFARRYCGLNEDEGCCRGVIRAGMSSVAQLFVAQLQDWLEADARSRVNVPGTPEGNWRWRVDARRLSGGLAREMAETTRRYSR